VVARWKVEVPSSSEEALLAAEGRCREARAKLAALNKIGGDGP
jgi:hypothetical protein